MNWSGGSSSRARKCCISASSFGMLAIASTGLVFALTSILVRPFSRVASVVTLLAGIGYVVASVTRIRCVNGAAFCGVGDRRRTDLENTRGYIHEAATLSATLLVVIAMAALGVALVRQERRGGGVASLVAAGATVVTFVLASGDSPGTEQRVWVAVMLLWALAVAVWTLMRGTDARSTVAAI